VIGKEFPLGLLKQVVDYSDETIQRLLSRLRDAEFIYEQPAFPEPDYVFKHALTQEVAYNSLLVERRKVLHERTAIAIETIFHNRLEDQYSELASHYSRSENIQKAVNYLQLAGQQAVQQSANMEAVIHFTAALELLKTLVETSDRAQQELTLQLALVTPLGITTNFADSEVGKVSARALTLCQQVGKTPQLFVALWSAWAMYLSRSELQTAHELAEQLLPLAQRMQDAAFLVIAHSTIGSILELSGEAVSARTHFERAVALYEPQTQCSTIALVGADYGVASYSLLAQVLWLLGYPDQALTQSRTALTRTQEIAHPYSTAAVWTFDSMLYQALYEVRTVQQRAEALAALCQEQGFSLLFAGALVWSGWALAVQGQGQEGVKQIQQGLAAAQAMGSEFFWLHHLTLLVDAYEKTGQREEGLAVLAEVLTVVKRTEERWWEAELHRLKGELTLQKGMEHRAQSRKQKSENLNPNSQILDFQLEAEACFHNAIDIARRQQAKSLELRATMSLARLWQQQGKRAEAHRMLSEVYNWFTEGFDTKDLQEAKALLVGLERKAPKRPGQRKKKEQR
jgi:predicted ATPase